MPDYQKEHNPGRYRELSIPKVDSAEATKDIDSFLEEVKASRIKHRIADCSVIVMIPYMDTEGEEVNTITSMHFGLEINSPLMAAHYYGTAKETNDQLIDRLATRRRKLR